jgi:hypothetical protein
MRYFNQVFLILSSLFSSYSYAWNAFADFLYWQASESAEWALTNNLDTNNQNVSYKTIRFNFAPGFRLGIEHTLQDWHGRLSYTHYDISANDSTHGTVISAFEAGKFTQKFSNSAQVNFGINYNMFDGDLFKEIIVHQKLIFRPLIGVKGGWINQFINTYFQGQANLNETLVNNFSGIGPKVGIESQWHYYQKNNTNLSFFANCHSGYLWGNWYLSDTLKQSNSSQINQVLVGKRDFGVFMINALLGINLSYQDYNLKMAYEVSDWFNQYQVFDNTTGARNNDLVLQGLTLGLNRTWA